jgi:hypothetical protein
LSQGGNRKRSYSFHRNRVRTTRKDAKIGVMMKAQEAEVRAKVIEVL